MSQQVRVLEHSRTDQISIGYSFSTNNIVTTAQALYNQEDEKLRWTGGAYLAVPKYYRRIALVDAVTLQPVMEVFNGREWDQRLIL